MVPIRFRFFQKIFSPPPEKTRIFFEDDKNTRSFFEEEAPLSAWRGLVQSLWNAFQTEYGRIVVYEYGRRSESPPPGRQRRSSTRRSNHTTVWNKCRGAAAGGCTAGVGWAHGFCEDTTNKLLDALVRACTPGKLLQFSSSPAGILGGGTHLQEFEQLKEVATDLEEFALKHLKEFLSSEELPEEGEESYQVFCQRRTFSKLARVWTEISLPVIGVEAGITGEREFLERVLSPKRRREEEEVAEQDNFSKNSKEELEEVD